MTFFHLKLSICAYCAQSNLGKNKKNYPFICTGTEFLCSRNKTSYEENRLKFTENKKKVLTLYNQMYYIIKFLSF